MDDLFSPEAPPPPPVDRLRRVARILSIAAPLNVLGVFCFTGVPGAVLALVGWQLADEEIARVESGALPKSELKRARMWRNVAFGQLAFAIVSLSFQLFLFSIGVYDALFELLAGMVAGLF